MDSKEELKRMISLIKEWKGWTQQQVSTGAGYEPNSLSQALSKKEGHEAVIKTLRIAYKDLLEIPIVPKFVPQGSGVQKTALKNKKTPGGMPGVDWEKEYWKLKEQFDKLYEKVTFVQFNSDGELETTVENQSSPPDLSQSSKMDSEAGKTGVFPIKNKKRKDKIS